ncbi:hypothetical protein PG994_003545 [Apiospora phragmitis]|uniref:Uncharacterized protein n=1 Tax=Apiospora phragmitis TaxID=2905665 RepID=A0ABR1VYH9_9PEZI
MLYHIVEIASCVRTPAAQLVDQALLDLCDPLLERLLGGLVVIGGIAQLVLRDGCARGHAGQGCCKASSNNRRPHIGECWDVRRNEREGC